MRSSAFLRFFAPLLCIIVLLCVFVLTLAHPASAAVTIYNFQVGPNNATYTGTGALGAGGPVFNRVDYSGTSDVNSVADARSSTGVVTPGVSLTLHCDGRFDAGSKDGFGSPTPISAKADDAPALLQNFATIKNNSAAAITLSGLPPLTSFKIVFYGTNGTFSDGTRGTKFTLYKDAGLKTVTGSAVTTCTTMTRFAAPSNFVTLSGTTDPGGNVFAAYTGAVGSEGDFNGLQIQVGKP